MTRSFSPRLGLLVSLGVTLIIQSAGFAHAQSCDPQVARTSVQGTVESATGAGGQLAAGQAERHVLPRRHDPRPGAKPRRRRAARPVGAAAQRQRRRSPSRPPKDERTGVIDLVQGAAHFFSRGPRSLEVKTPFTVAGVRGTEFYIERGAGPGAADGVRRDRRRRTTRPAASTLDRAANRPSPSAGKAPVAQVVARPARRRPVGALLPARRLFPPGRVPPGRAGRARCERSLEAYDGGRSPAGVRPHRQRRRTVSDPRVLRLSRLAAARRRPRGRGARGHRSARCSLRAERCRTPWRCRRSSRSCRTTRTGRSHVAQQAVAGGARTRPRRTIALSYAQQARFDLRGRAREPREGGASWSRRTRWRGRGSPSSSRRSANLDKSARGGAEGGRRCSRICRGPRPCSASPT